MSYKTCREKLVNYFGNVTYIDDQFDFALVEQKTEEIEVGTEGVPLPAFDISKNESIEQADQELTQEQRSAINLSNILMSMTTELYSSIRFSPVLYTETTNDKQLLGKIENAPLTMIDWKLGTNKTAYSIITDLFSNSMQLKVIVVYTSDYNEALAAFKQDPQLSEYLEIKTDKQQFSAYKCNHQSLLIIASKLSYNLLDLLDIVSDLFLENCGLLPVALLDYMESAQQLSDELFSAFCRPFEDVYFLQMYFSEISEAEAPDSITTFIQNKFREAFTIDSDIVNELYIHQKNRLAQLMGKEKDELSSSISTAIDALAPHFKGIELEFCNSIKTLDSSLIVEKYQCAAKTSATWRDLLSNFSVVLDLIQEEVINLQLAQLLTPYKKLDQTEELVKAFDESKSAMRTIVEAQIKDAMVTFKRQVFPLFIQILISSPSMLNSGAELVQNTKYRVCAQPALDVILDPGKNLSRKRKEAFLLNKFHFGDILLKQVDATKEYLLCITPPCDVCRPSKTKLKLNFIKGVELSQGELNIRRKENVHISLVPIKEGDSVKLKYVCWGLYDIVKFDLNNSDDYQRISAYSRPMIMSEQYVRQIANQFTAYFSRAGVDEMFIKSESSLRALFN